LTEPWRTPVRKVLESDVEKSCTKKAARRGYWSRKFTSPSNRSVPDRVFGRHGVVFWVEFKRPGGKTTANQDEEIALMRAHGLTVYVIDNVAAFDALLDSLDAEEFLL
jgi:hypothetical protein